MHITIVGGGPAGLVAAIAARQAGFDCTVYERAPNFERIGGAVGIQSNGLAVLDAIGVLEHFRPRIEIMTRVGLEAPPGRVISAADFRDVSLPFQGFAAALRYDLQETLLGAALDAGATIVFDKHCTRVARRDDLVVITFAGGDAIASEIVFGCDGIRSVVRESLGIKSRKRVVNEAYLRAVAPIEHPDRSRIGETWANDGRRAGSFPLPGGRTYLFCSVPLGQWEHILSHELADWIGSWRDFGPPIETLMQSITDWRSAVYDELTDLRAERWHEDGVFLLGDAAHAMTPNLGQGANSAMVDALVLVNLLAEHAGDRRVAGVQYERIRKEFVTRLQRTALLGGRMASWTSAPARFVRDTFFRTGSRIGPLRRASTRLTAGFNPLEQPWLRPPTTAVARSGSSHAEEARGGAPISAMGAAGGAPRRPGAR